MTENQNGSWLMALRRYLMFLVAGNLLWETLHLPLYMIWRDGTVAELAFAVVHCTGGDFLIGLTSLALALLLIGEGDWPQRSYWSVAALTIAFGVSYTIFSEWLNVEVRENWVYSELMPTIPAVGTGLSPVAQWVAIPLIAFWWSRRPFRAAHSQTAPENAATGVSAEPVSARAYHV